MSYFWCSCILLAAWVHFPLCDCVNVSANGLSVYVPCNWQGKRWAIACIGCQSLLCYVPAHLWSRTDYSRIENGWWLSYFIWRYFYVHPHILMDWWERKRLFWCVRLCVTLILLVFNLFTLHIWSEPNHTRVHLQAEENCLTRWVLVHETMNLMG